MQLESPPHHGTALPWTTHNASIQNGHRTLFWLEEPTTVATDRSEHFYLFSNEFNISTLIFKTETKYKLFCNIFVKELNLNI